MDELDILAQLHEAARELLSQADELNRQVPEATPTDETIGRLKDRLEAVCAALKRVHTALSLPGFLPELARRVDGLPIADSLRRLERFLDEHRAALRRLGLEGAPRAVSLAISLLERELATPPGGDGLAKPAGFTQHDVEDTLRAIEQLRDMVCRLAKAAEMTVLLATPTALKAVAQGAVGAALVVVDVTGAITVAPHDFTGWTLIKAVKSVWSGASMVKRSWETLSGFFGSGPAEPPPPPPPRPPTPSRRPPLPKLPQDRIRFKLKPK